jgi:hypothetical protein
MFASDVPARKFLGEVWNGSPAVRKLIGLALMCFPSQRCEIWPIGVGLVAYVPGHPLSGRVPARRQDFEIQF